MPIETLSATVDQAIADRRLLEHPYYRAWQDGDLSDEDLRAYATQYRHIEAALPQVLAATAGTISDEKARALTESNLAEELSTPAPHLELFDRFATALGVTGTSDPTPGTRRLVDTYFEAAARGPVSALSAIAAYEVQAAEIASSKADALRRHHGLGEGATEFWDVHAVMETDHAAWTLDALESLAAASEEVHAWAERSSAAWWRFLDERAAGRV